MGKKIDLTGQVFGEWTVIEQDLDNSKQRPCAYWICRCSCGNVKTVSSQSLRTGASKSCGCKKIKDLTGQRFGFLEALELDTLKHERTAYWICLCHGCGKKVSVESGTLQYRDKSCGCQRFNIISESRSAHLENQTFGYLQVIERDTSRPRGHDAYWKCKCLNCGNTTIVRTTDLQKGTTTSCGCIASKGEAKINKLLTEMQIKYITQYKFKDLVSEKNVPLRFDYFLPDYNILIEYQGLQHYQSSEYFGGEEHFKIQKRHDQMKRDYCQKNNLTLIEIIYKDYDKINEDYINKLLEKYKKENKDA